MSISARVDGLEPLLAKLETMKRTMGVKIARRAIGAGTKILLREAKAKTPRRHGLLKKSQGRKIKVYRQSGTVVGIVGPRTGFGTVIKGKKVDPVKYGPIVEARTRFMTQARDSAKGAVASAIKTELAAGIEQEARSA